jgi:DNA invertase Pin-like site-specific DNA recombinase
MRLQDCLESGLTVIECARKTGISKATVNREKAYLAGEPYNAIASHKLAMQRRYKPRGRPRKIPSQENINSIIKDFSMGMSQPLLCAQYNLSIFTIRKITRTIKPETSIQERFEVLEEQVKLLFETVKEMRRL